MIVLRSSFQEGQLSFHSSYYYCVCDVIAYIYRDKIPQRRKSEREASSLQGKRVRLMTFVGLICLFPSGWEHEMEVQAAGADSTQGDVLSRGEPRPGAGLGRQVTWEQVSDPARPAGS